MKETWKFWLIPLLLAAVTLAEKQIKLEDIEKDNLKADQEAKFQKQLQQQYQQQLHYESAQYETPSKTSYQHLQNYQTQQPQGYLIPYNPQQILQALYRNYPQLTTNNIGSSNYQPPVHPLQAYFGNQPYVLPSVAMGNQRPIIMAIMPHTLAHLQAQQSYMQGSFGNPYQNYQQGSVYYTPEVMADQQKAVSTQTQTFNIPYNSPQQYVPVPQIQSMIATKGPFQYQYLTGAAQNFPNSYHQNYIAAYSNPQQQQEFSSVGNAAIFLPTRLHSQTSSSASAGQHQQYLQAQTTTISPVQSKFLNSPQYLAQNYNTISSSQYVPKEAFSTAIKATPVPPVKVTQLPSYVSSNPSYQTYRSIAG